jgi:hypothetical protein
VDIEVYKETGDDWYPAYELGKTKLVKVAFCRLLHDEKDEWMVSAWGADDFGMDRIFTSKIEAWDCFMEILSMDNVTQSALNKLWLRVV